MLEDFGWSGDEFLMGDCMDDWTMDILDLRADEYAERRRMMEVERKARLLAEDEVDDEYDSQMERVIAERDALDFVREQEESMDDGDEYLDCEWEE